MTEPAGEKYREGNQPAQNHRVNPWLHQFPAPNALMTTMGLYCQVQESMRMASVSWSHALPSLLKELWQVPEPITDTEPPSHSVSLVTSSDSYLKPRLIWKTLGYWVEVLLMFWTCTWRFSFSFETSQSKTDGIFPPLCFPHRSAF